MARSRTLLASRDGVAQLAIHHRRSNLGGTFDQFDIISTEENFVARLPDYL